MFLNFSLFRLALLAVIPKLLYVTFSLIKYGSFEVIILFKSVLGNLSTTLIVTLLFILLVESLFHKLSNKKYLLLLETLIISIVIFNLTPPEYIDYINLNKTMLGGITYYIIDVVSVFIIYFIPNIIKRK